MGKEMLVYSGALLSLPEESSVTHKLVYTNTKFEKVTPQMLAPDSHAASGSKDV